MGGLQRRQHISCSDTNFLFSHVVRCDEIFQRLYMGPSFSVLLSTPCRNLADQIKRQRLVIGELDGSLTGFVSLQPACKGFYRRRTGIQTDVFFGCRKLNQIPLFPVRRHTPGNLLHSVRQCVFDGIMDLTEIWLDIFRLLCNIFFNVLRGSAAVMALICILKLPSAFGAFPHGVPPPYS